MNRISKISRIVPGQWTEGNWPVVVAVAGLRKRLEERVPATRRDQRHFIRLALNEAEALAWDSGYPALVFPLLAEEKLAALQQWTRRQEALWEGPFEMAFAA